jgi:amino acid permease
MNSGIYCYAAAAFFIASIYLSLIKTSDYKDSLNSKEKEKYKSVIKERVKIYLIASTVGLLVVGNLYFMNIRQGSSTTTACYYTAIYFLVEYFVYSLLPKKHWMLQSVENNQDALDWLKKYRFMKNNWHYGLVFGIISFGLFSYFVLKNDN